MNSNRIVILAMLVISSPGLLLQLSGTDLGIVTNTALFGISIVAAAFILAWSAEAAEMDITQGLAVAFVALIAVLPEYAVDMSFA